MYKRQVIRHYYQGERLADIATEMGMSLSTVKRQLRQAKGRLRRGLGQLAVVPLGLALPVSYTHLDVYKRQI